MSKSGLLITALLLICALIWVGVWRESSQLMKVIFFDAGSGDSCLILFPHGGTMLIDGGNPGYGERIIIPYLRKKGIKKLSTLILTNASPGHVGGLIEILKEVEVDLVLVNRRQEKSPLYEEFAGLAARKHISCKTVHEGQELRGFCGVRLEFFNPPEYPGAGEESDWNNSSVVVKMTYGRIQFLFCSDIQHKAEEDMVNIYGSRLHSRVIRVPCQGSELSSSWDFLKQVSPDIAVISAGRKNKPEHLESITLEKYRKTGCRIYRTDVNGAVIITTCGKNLKVKVMR